MIALSQAIRAIVVNEGNYASIVRGAGVRQPLVSLALHRRLVVRTAHVDRLFEFLNLTRSRMREVDAAFETDEEGRTKLLLGLLVGLSDGSAASDERLAAVLAALKGFSETATT